MNHLCNSHCEFCGDNLPESYIEEGEGFTFFTIQLVETRGSLPSIIDYGFQADFSCSVCWKCATYLLASDKSSYAWNKCHCCGLDTKKDDISAFRMFEVEAEDIEQHPYNRDLYEFVSANIATKRGPVGYTVCMNCVLPELISHSDSSHEMLKTVVSEAIDEGDVYAEHSDLLPS
jgi:PHP family Zn ribbon phosphoesterase